MAPDVLEEDELGPGLVDDPVDDRPEVPGVVGSAALPGHGEGLARIPGSEPTNSATIRSAVEGTQIRPNRRRSQPTFVHLLRQDFAGKGFDLHMSDNSAAGNSQLESAIESASPGAEGQDGARARGKIHIHLPLPSGVRTTFKWFG